MMNALWRVPGSALSSSFLTWFVMITFLSGTLGSTMPEHVASVASIAPFLFWLLAVLHQLHGCGRIWCNRGTSIFIFAYWLLYLLVLLPTGIDTTGSIAGSATLGTLGNLLFSSSIIVVFDQLAYAIPREERRIGIGRTGYTFTLLQSLFPPLALWVVHNRVAAVAGIRSGTVA